MDRSLNIPEPQILLHFPEDAGGYFHHHRILMHRVSGSQWVLLTPDLELEVADLSARRHRILPRHGVFPADIADECYVFDEVPRAEMERQRRMAKTMGSILGDAQVVNVDIQQWYVSDPSSARFGQALPVEIVGDVVALGQHGVVQRDDETEYVREMATSEIERFKESKKDSLGDARLLGEHKDPQGKRHMTLQDALALMSEEKFDDWGFVGPRATREYLVAIREGPGDLISYHNGWVRSSGISNSSAIAHEHRSLIETLRLGFSKDQLDLSNLTCMENVVRRLIVLEMAVARNPAAPDFSGLDVVSETPIAAQGQAYVSAITSWVTEKLKERSQIQKQARLFKEEFGRRGGKKFGDEDDEDSGKNKWKKKKKTADGGGAVGSAAAS